MDRDAYIHLQEIRHVFGASSRSPGVLALDDVSFGVRRGEFLSILGPSGCGKTTLLRMIDGLIKPTKGRILIDGREVRSPGPDRAMVFQDFGLLPWRTALQNVEMGLEFQGKPKAERRKIAHETIDKVGLVGFENSFPHQLSGGMRQRVGLARALSITPDVFLMDEPFGSLDAQTRELMQEELLRIWDQYHRTVVFVTHSIDEAIFCSDRVLIMSARPGQVKVMLDVDLPRPRTQHNVRATREFGQLREHAWGILREEIAQSQLRTGGVPLD